MLDLVLHAEHDVISMVAIFGVFMTNDNYFVHQENSLPTSVTHVYAGWWWAAKIIVWSSTVNLISSQDGTDDNLYGPY